MERRGIALGLALLALLCTTNAIAQTNMTTTTTAANPLLAIETHRAAIINRLVFDYAKVMAELGLDAEGLRSALAALRADQLLAATLVSTLDDVLRVIHELAVTTAAAGQRYVAITPVDTLDLRSVPDAQSYLVRDGDVLRVVKPAELQLTGRNSVVGYFSADPATTSATVVAQERVRVKDGSGSGTNSWIGYTGGSNSASGSGSAVASGRFNSASGPNSFVGAGQSNSAAGTSSLVLGGFDNHATVIDATVVAGAGNRATGARSVVVGGGYNLASGQWSFIGGGGRQVADPGAAGTSAHDNIAAGDFSAIGGGQGNRAMGYGAAMGGGLLNTVTGAFGTVGGGGDNYANGESATVAGGAGNLAEGGISTVSGGNLNFASGHGASVGGGVINRITVDGDFGTVGGGSGNAVSGLAATVAGGTANIVSGLAATVAGGAENIASGIYSFVGGGYSNSASGAYSVALGKNAGALHHGCFIWSDNSSADPTSCFANNEFVARALGGFYFFTSGTNDFNYAGARLAPNTGAWAAYSDRNGKEDVEPVDPRAVLEKLASVPMATWRWKNEDARHRHMGPMAQDFYEAFGLGADGTHIVTVDADGVALAAIQGLYQQLRHELQERDARIALQQVAIETQRAQLAAQSSEVAVTRLQVQDLVQSMSRMQQEVGTLRQARDVALAPK